MMVGDKSSRPGVNKIEQTLKALQTTTRCVWTLMMWSSASQVN